MSEEGYRAPDFTLQNRIDAHTFSKAAVSAACLPLRINLALWQSYASLWGVHVPKEEERGVVIPISEFASFGSRRHG